MSVTKEEKKEEKKKEILVSNIGYMVPYIYVTMISHLTILQCKQ